MASIVLLEIFLYNLLNVFYRCHSVFYLLIYKHVFRKSKTIICSMQLLALNSLKSCVDVLFSFTNIEGHYFAFVKNEFMRQKTNCFSPLGFRWYINSSR